MFLGTAANVITVLIGSTIGGVAGTRFPERIRSTVMAGLDTAPPGLSSMKSLQAAGNCNRRRVCPVGAVSRMM